MDIRKL